MCSFRPRSQKWSGVAKSKSTPRAAAISRCLANSWPWSAVPVYPRSRIGAIRRTMASVTAAAVFPSAPISPMNFEARSPQEIKAPRGIPPMIRSSFPSPIRPLASPIRRAFGDVHPTGKMTASRRSPDPPVRLLPAAAQAPVKVSPRLSVRSHRWVDPFPAGHHLPGLLKPARDGFRAPACPQPLLRHRPALGGHLPRHSRGGPTSARRLALGWLISIPALPAVAGRLPRHRGGIPFELAGDLAFRQTPMQQGMNLASFAMGQGDGRRKA